MIWVALGAAIAAAFAGASGRKPESLLREWLADWRKRLRKHVDDDERERAGLEIIDRATENLEIYFDDVQAQLLALYRVHSRYESTLADYEPGIDALGQLFGELEARYIITLGAMHEVLSDAEWRTILAEIDVQNSKQLERLDTQKAKQQAKQHAEQ